MAHYAGLAILTIVIALVFAAVFASAIHNRSRSLPAENALLVQSRRVLTDAELLFLGKLSQAVEHFPDISILAQVSMAAIVHPRPGLSKTEHYRTFAKVAQKRIDFVLVDAATNPALIIELDDRTHRRARDEARDAITATAGLKTVRFNNPVRLSAAGIADAIRPAIVP